VEVAGIYERELKDDEAAINGYRQALEFDPANREALDALEQLYTKLDRPAELLSVYERQLEVSEDYRERVRVLAARGESATVELARALNGLAERITELLRTERAAVGG
jgi:tetratricopeptide (TPR) repeat protein